MLFFLVYLDPINFNIFQCSKYPMDASGSCASSNASLAMITDCAKGINSELQQLKQHKTQPTLISTLLHGRISVHCFCRTCFYSWDFVVWCWIHRIILYPRWGKKKHRGCCFFPFHVFILSYKWNLMEKT